MVCARFDQSGTTFRCRLISWVVKAGMILNCGFFCGVRAITVVMIQFAEGSFAA